MLICNKARMAEGRKPRKILCTVSGMACAHVRYCAVAMNYYQTDAAKNCLLKEDQDGRQKNQAGAVDRI